MVKRKGKSRAGIKPRVRPGHSAVEQVKKDRAMLRRRKGAGGVDVLLDRVKTLL